MMIYPKPKRTKKCKQCGKRFEVELEGRLFFYTHKYCSDECRKIAQSNSNKVRSFNQKIKMQKKFEELKSVHGKITRKCKTCGKDYQTYASHIKARGSNYCSKKCMNQKKRKQAPVPRLKKMAWDIFSKYIRLRDAIKTTGTSSSVKCITCDDIRLVVEVDAGHLFSRTNTAILFDEHNVHAQCKKCNMPPNNGEQYLYSQKVIAMYGIDEFNRLVSLRHKIRRFTRIELEDFIAEYTIKAKQMMDEYGSPWANIK